ncbi:MAG: hypothetical protein ACK55I_42700, partial [bacterium]
LGPLLAAAKADGVFPGERVHERRLPLPAVEHGTDAIRGHRLRPEDVARVCRAFVEAPGVVAVEDRAAEGHVLGRVTVASERHMAAGEQELKRAAAGLAQERDRLAVAEAAAVVLHLAVEALVPGGIDEALEDLADEPPLVRREEVAGDLGVGGVPVVAHPGPQQAE